MSLRHPVAHVTREMRFQKNENEMYFHEMYFHDMYFRDNAYRNDLYCCTHGTHLHTFIHIYTHLHTWHASHICKCAMTQ